MTMSISRAVGDQSYVLASRPSKAASNLPKEAKHWTDARVILGGPEQHTEEAEYRIEFMFHHPSGPVQTIHALFFASAQVP